MGGRSSKCTPGGVTRLGPAKDSGLARSDHCGSVRMFTPASWISSVAWPIQVTVGSVWFARSATPSPVTGGSSRRRGAKVAAHMRRMKNVVRVQKGGRPNSGLALAKPCWRWWAGAPAHHRQHGFANANPEFGRPPFWTRTTFFIRRMWAATFAPRRLELPPVTGDGVALRANQTEPTVTWIGHATLLIQLAGVNILTDPQWSERASPLSFAGPKRVTPPGVHFEDLPPIHVVVI